MARWTMRFTVACWLLGASLPAGTTAATGPSPAGQAGSCLSCHISARGMLASPMATRAPERAFARRAFGREGDAFFEASCAGCHVASCGDCHGPRPHAAGKPKDDACLRCHRGYFIGADYYGRAPREDHSRYQRGTTPLGEPFLKMLPDVHRERGLGCADCHTMQSMVQAKKSARTCRDCHAQPSADVPEHAITAHMERMECVACHAAWAAQEYGTFLVRPLTPEQQEAFAPLPAVGPWRKSAYLKRQDAPPLGLNARGRVTPIRPQFILFATDPSRGWENRLLAAEWKAFSPHSVRRGSVSCAGCHEQPRRYLLEEDADRLYLLEKDGLPLRSFWSRRAQTVSNGSFLPERHHSLMNRKTPEYVRQHLRQWKRLLEPADRSSRR